MNMKRSIILLTAAFSVSLAVFAFTAKAAEASNSIDISENFDTASPAGAEVYTGSSDDYKWNILATRDFGYATNNTYVAIPDANKTAVSLTKNNENNGTENVILTIPKGAGGADRDVDISFDAGACYGFSQAAKAWDLVFSSSGGEELFSLRFRNGSNVKVAALVVNGEVLDTDYDFPNGTFTNVKATVSFEEDGGGTVTFKNVSADFAAGSDIAQIAVKSSSTSDYNRPFVIDNFTMKTYDKTRLYFNVASTGEGQSVRGAELNIDFHTYRLGADGSFTKYFRPGTSYPYTVRLQNHEQAEGSLTAYTADRYIDTYTFSNVGARRPLLVHAYYDETTGALESVTSENIPVSNNKYTVTGERRHGLSEKYFLWNSVKGMKPYAAAEIKEGEKDTVNVQLIYHQTVTADRVELSGGDEYIYIPEEGYAQTSPLTATVYDNLGFVMRDAVIEWSLPEETAQTIGIVNGAVTIGEGYNFTENAHTVKIRASVRGSDVYADRELVVRKVSDVDSFTVTGPAVIKNGTTAQYTVGSITDIYGKESEEIPDFTLTAYDGTGSVELDADSAGINGLTITPNIDLGGAREKKIKLVIALNGTDKTEEIPVTVYDYDFYEPGVGTASYGNPRMETVNNKVSIVWPATQSGTRTTSIPLPKAVNLTAGSCKVLTFENFATVDTVSSQERSLRITNSDGNDIVNIGYSSLTRSENGRNVHYVNVLNNLSDADNKSIGDFALNRTSNAEITFKTDAEGITSVIFKINGTTTVLEEPVGMVYDIAEIRMRGGTSAPDARLLAITNIKIDDGEISGVEITGSDKVAVALGADAQKQFGVKVFSHEENETFTWSVDDGANAIDGVTINQDGVLTVSDSVKSLIDASALNENGISYITAVVRYTGSKGSSAVKTIKIMDYAGVSGFSLTGPEYIEAGTLTASYRISDITDDYGNEADMQKAYMITTGGDIASINTATGDVTLAEGKTGTFTVTAAVGNAGKTKVIDLPVTVAKYSETGDADGSGEALVDVTKLANYAADTKYLVTTAKDGEIVNQSEQTAKDGMITVDTAGADKYEVSPIFAYTGVGSVADGKTIPICDGVYDFTFKKTSTTRADILVNGAMVGQNVDQVSIQRTLSGGSEYTAADIKVDGGKAVVTMKDTGNYNMDSITVRKTPSIVNRKTHVYVLGDSLASAYYGEYDSVDENGVPLPGTGQAGWGETLGLFLADDMVVTNLAESGSAAATLYATTFQGIIQNAEAGDFLVMECGYQDEPNSTLQMMLTSVDNIYKACREKGVELILVTPNCAAHGTTNITAISRDGGVRFGPDLMNYARDIETYKREEILGVDLSGADTVGNEYSMLIDFGEEYWLNNFNLVRPEDGVAVDRLHSSYWGAVLHAANIATAIDEAQRSENNTELGERLSGLHLNYDARYIMTDSNGDEVTFKIGWYSDIQRGTDPPEQQD